MIELQDRHVAVIGLGESGLAMARWAAFKGARVTVLDDRDSPPQRDALAAQCPGAKLVCAAFTLAAVGNAQVLAWSPGLSPLTGAAAALYQAALDAGLPVVGELDLFADELARRAQDGYRPKVLASTGTNGKTTVTQLAGHLAAEAGLDVQMAGNISPALLHALQQSTGALQWSRRVGLESTRLPDLEDDLEAEAFGTATQKLTKKLKSCTYGDTATITAGAFT